MLQACINTFLKLEESRLNSKEIFKQQQEIVKRWFDKWKSRKGNFEIGDLVLKWDNPHENKGKHTKFKHLWVGPYQIAEKLGHSTYKLQYLQGQEESIHVNDLVLKHYSTYEFGTFLYINKAFLFLFFFSLFFLFDLIWLTCYFLIINQLNIGCLEI